MLGLMLGLREGLTLSLHYGIQEGKAALGARPGQPVPLTRPHGGSFLGRWARPLPGELLRVTCKRPPGVLPGGAPSGQVVLLHLLSLNPK